ncbi:MAG: alanine racemase [Opitutales bacterium]|nr:alanine racemase [Opitutales bacterium]
MEFSRTQLRCSVQIDLYALERNLGKIRHYMPGEKSYIALVSADAFGIGMEAAAARLMLSGADAFAVTNLSEAARVRKVGQGWPVIVLSASVPGEETFFIERDITAVLASLEEVERFEAAAEKLGKKAVVHMKLPSANPNLSIPDVAQARAMLAAIMGSQWLTLEAFCVAGTGTGAPEESDIPDPGFLRHAAGTLINLGQKAYIHHSDMFDASILPEGFQTSLRAGLVLFGIAPEKNSVLETFKPEQVITFRSAVSHIKRLPKGAYVGYAKTYRLERDSKIALLSVGYGDGLARSASSNANVIIRDTLVPIIGRVSMDQVAVDVTNLARVELSDEAIIIGSSQTHSISIEEYCGRLGISPAEALTSFTQRVVRIYRQS